MLSLFLSGDLYTTLSNGELYIRQISEKDISRSTFQCETRNRLTGEVSLSLTKGRLYLTRKYFGFWIYQFDFGSLNSPQPGRRHEKSVARMPPNKC